MHGRDLRQFMNDFLQIREDVDDLESLDAKETCYPNYWSGLGMSAMV